MTHTRYFEVAGLTIRFDSALPISDDTLAPKFKLFETGGPGKDNVHISHRFFLPDTNGDFGRRVYCRSPWVIYRNGDQWVYILETSPDPAEKQVRQISFVSADHTGSDIYNGSLIRDAYTAGNLGALTMAPTDQVLLARLLADRDGCYIHSDGVNMDGKGYLFVGHSGAGKSTIAEMLRDKAEILCDDRMIVRRWDDGYYIHGNWSHGTMPVVSAGCAPLARIFFLEKADENRIIPMERPMNSISLMLACLVKPLATADWWEKMLVLIEDMVRSVPCYRLAFDKSGRVYEALRRL